ncbi:MAG: hypothetical protein J0L92_27900 [Deltaproteobacteria bacterium]|nr:hypothetical protein [Deltaproteobacteria bacterium]
MRATHPALRFRTLTRSAVLVASLGGTALASGCPRETNELPDAFFVESDTGPSVIDAAVDGGPAPEMCTMPGATLGETCGGNEECDDHCFCNGAEECRSGTCQAGTVPCREDMVDCTTIACAENLDRCSVMTDDSMCADDDACNGAEACNPTRGCQPGPAPVCNDETSCTVDSCDPATGCVYTPRDLDGDGYVASTCEGGSDCDDDPRYGTMVFPGATEICDNRRDDDCDGSRDYNDSSCIPTNDTCDVATVLTLGPMGGTFSGATTGLRHSYTVGCGTGSGPDAIFRFTLSEMRDVRISATAAGASVALRQFDQCASGPDDKCNTGSPPTLVRRSLPAGEYAIIVTTASPQAFDVSVRLTDPTVPPPVDVCNDGTTLIPLTGGTFSGRFEEVEDDYALTCNSFSGRDAVYAFEIPVGQVKDLRVTGSITSGSWSQTYLSLTTDCGNRAAEMICESDGTTTSIDRRDLGPGRYYIIVEGTTDDATDYNLTVTLTDPLPRIPGDVCSMPLDVTPAAIPGTRTQMVDISRLDPLLDARPSCGPVGSGRDAVFTFTTTAVQDLTLTINGTGTLYGAMMTTCGTPATETGCWTSSSGTLTRTWRSLAAGTYYFIVQTTSTFGTMTANLDVRTPTPIPMNDRCPGIALTAPAFRTDTTIGFTSEVNLTTCGGSGSPDAFYSFTLGARSRVVAVATRGAGGTITAAIQTTCGATSTLACGGGSSTTANISTTLDPGTYYLVVETPSSSESDFTLDFFVTAL